MSTSEVPTRAGAGERVVWRIGRLDGGAEQFAAGPRFDAGCDELRFRVGVDDESSAWPSYQPGPLMAWTGYRSKRVAVDFHLDAPPSTACELRLRLLTVTGPPPDVDVSVNGRRGRWFLDPVRRDRTDLSSPSHIGGWDLLRVPVDSAWLQRGENRIVVATVQDDAVDPAELGPMHPEYPYFWGSVLRHGGVELVETGEAMPARSVRVSPTPLFVRRDGAFCELVDVVVTAPAGVAAGAVSLTVAGAAPVSAALDPAGRDTGQVRVRLAVPDLGDTPCDAEISVALDGAPIREQITLRPCRKWTVHLLPHVHLDVGYTDVQAKVFEVHSRNLDRVLSILGDVPEYRYSVDGGFVLEQFARSRSAESRESVLAALRDGSLSVNAFMALFLTGIASLEECYRAGYGTAALRREHGVPVDYANLTDVPSYSSAMPSVLRAMGVDAFAGIQNHGRAATEDGDVLHLVSPFLWEGPDGAQVLSFFADCYAQLRYICGHPTTVTGSALSLTRLLGRYERDDYLPHDFPLVGIYSDNEDLGDGEAGFVARWNAAYEYPRLRYSTLRDYFAAVRPLRDRLPVVRGDGGSFWEDGVGSSASLTAAYRRAQALLPVAEACSALVQTVDPSLRAAVDDLDRAWQGLLIGCEHTWTWMHAHEHPHGEQTDDQLGWKRAQVDTALRVAVDETRRAMSQLGELVQTDGPSLLLFNALGWRRDGVVEVELPRRLHVIGEDGAPVPSEVTWCDTGLQRVRLRSTVPGLGYRRLTLAEQPDPDGVSTAGLAPLDGDLVETRRHRLRVDRGTGRIVSLWSTTLQRELLDCEATGVALAEVLYVRSENAARDSIHEFSRHLPAPSLTVTPAAMRVAGVRRTPWGAVVALRGEAPSLPRVEVDVELHDDEERVDVTVRLDKEAVHATESVYVAFPFAVPDATLRYDRQQGWVDPAADHAPGACNEWFTTQHAVGLDGGGAAVTWCSADAPLFTVGDVVRGRWPRHHQPGSSTLLSWVMNNHWWTNYAPAQSGEVTLRYSFTAAQRWDAAAAARFGREARTPLAVSTVTWLDKMDTGPRRLSQAAASLLDVEAPPNLTVTVAQARAGDGLLLRLQETAGIAASASVRHPFATRTTPRVERCTALEDGLAPLDVVDGRVRVEVAPYEIVSMRMSR
ncbi:MAG TPA: polysaccharide lyase family protein [Candidatus Dormibacteraeota bacterium]|nr:polysaccharide lyase family protein [Candidatus Dormibacteraeota bacterium]